MRAAFALALLLASNVLAQDAETARQRWMSSPLGPTLERILPPAVEPRTLPEPSSTGAALAVRYCVQCHNLPSPAMHPATKWPAVVERMAARMRGKGNLGKVMTELMAGVEAPSADEQRTLVAYLARYALEPLDPRSCRRSASRRRNRSASPASNATRSRTRDAIARRNGRRSSPGCRNTWRG